MSALLISGKKWLDEVELILLDKDGTLIDIHHYWSSMIYIRANKISEKWFSNDPVIVNELVDAMGVDRKKNRMKPQGPVGIKPRTYIATVVRKLICSKGVNVIDEDVEKVFKEVDFETSQNLKPLLRLLPDVKNFLDKVRLCGVKMAVVSTDISERVERTMDELLLSDYFCDLVGADRVENTKPAPDLANYVLIRHGVNPDNCVVIGDHIVDIQMGEGANIRNNIGVLTGLSGRGAFENHECAVVENLGEVDIRC